MKLPLLASDSPSATFPMSERALNRSARYGLTLVPLGATVALYAALIQGASFHSEGRLFFTLFDDAMISMRYARNLAHGDGLVWNPGDAPVEGYTNFLWTAWMAALHLSRIPEAVLSLGVMLSGIPLLMASAYVARRIALRVFDGSSVAAVAFWGTALYYPLAFWTLRGMEVGLITLLTLLAILAALRLRSDSSPRDACVLCGALALGLLTRMDFVVPAAVVIAWVVGSTKKARPALCLALCGTVAATLAAHSAFRLLYYGDLLPNTYYLKVAGVSPLTRLARGVESLAYLHAVHLFGALVPAAGYLYLRRLALRAEDVLLLAVAASLFLYSASVGGDAWESFGFANRYVVPAVPLLLMFASRGIEVLVSGERRADRVLVSALVGALFATSLLNVVLGSHGVRRLQVIPPSLEVEAARVGLPLVLAVALMVLRPAVHHGRGPTGGAALVTANVVLIVSLSAAPVVGWASHGAEQQHEDVAWARYGILLRQATEPDAMIAVTSAGAISYFSHRTTVDELGKSDSLIAKGPIVREVFQPGHSKWNLAHSIQDLRPDFIAQLFVVNPEDVGNIESWGYRRLTGSCFVRSGSNAVHEAELVAGIRALRSEYVGGGSVCAPNSRARLD